MVLELNFAIRYLELFPHFVSHCLLFHFFNDQVNNFSKIQLQYRSERSSKNIGSIVSMISKALDRPTNMVTAWLGFRRVNSYVVFLVRYAKKPASSINTNVSFERRTQKPIKLFDINITIYSLLLMFLVCRFWFSVYQNQLYHSNINTLKERFGVVYVQLILSNGNF